MTCIFDRWPEAPVPAELIETRKPETMNESKLEADDYWDKCRELLLQAATTICFQTGEDTLEWSAWLANGGLRELLDAQYQLSKEKPAGHVLVDAEEYDQLQASHRIKMENEQQPVNAQLLSVLKEMVEMMDSNDEHGEGSPWHTDAKAAIAAAEAEQPKSTLEKYNELMSDCTENDPLERLRFFCSLAMNSQDWLDVERFFIDMQQPPAVPDGWLNKLMELAHDYAHCMTCEVGGFDTKLDEEETEKARKKLMAHAMLAASKEQP